MLQEIDLAIFETLMINSFIRNHIFCVRVHAFLENPCKDYIGHSAMFEIYYEMFYTPFSYCYDFTFSHLTFVVNMMAYKNILGTCLN